MACQRERAEIALHVKSHLECVQAFRDNVGADFLPVDHIIALGVEVTHRPCAVTLVVTTIDLLSGQTQARQHGLRWLEHFQGQQQS